jgi:hypothetical protein
MSNPIRSAANRIAASLAIACIYASGAFGAMEPCKPYVSHTASGNDVNFTCGTGSLRTHHVRLRFCRPGMVEVSFSIRGEIKDTAFHNFEMWLKMNWPPVSIEVQDMGPYVMSRTSEITVRAWKDPFRIEINKPDIITHIAGDGLDPDANGVYGMASDGSNYILRKQKSATEHFFGFGDNYANISNYTFDRTGKIMTSDDYHWNKMMSPFFYSTDGYGLFLNFAPSEYSGTSKCVFDMGSSSPDYYQITFNHPAGKGRDFMTYYFIYGPEYPKVIDGFTEGAGVPSPTENARPPLLTKWVYGAYYGATQWENVKVIEDHVNGMRNGGFPYDAEIGDNHVCWKVGPDGYSFWPPAGDTAYNTAQNKNAADLVKWLDSKGLKFGENLDIANSTQSHGAGGWLPQTPWPNVPRSQRAQWYVDRGFDIQWSDAGGSRNHADNRETFNAWRQAFGGDASKVFMIQGWNNWCAHAFPTAWPGDCYGSTKTDLSGSMIAYSQPTHDGNTNVRALALSAQWRIHESYFGGYWPYKSDATRQAEWKRWANFRYRLIPYLFTCGGIAHETGAPIMRHMIWEDAQNSTTWNKADGSPYQQYYLGDWLLASPPDGQSAVSVWFPKGTWYDWFNGAKHDYNTIQANIDCGSQATGTVPLYARAGAIIPLMPIMQYVGAIPEDPLTLRVWPSGSSSFTLFEDETPVKTTFRCDASAGQDLVSIPAFGGSKYSPATRKYQLEVYTADRKPQKVARDNANTLLTELTTKAAYDAASSGWFYDAANHGSCYVKPAGDARNGFSVIISYNGTVAVSPRVAVDLGLIRIQQNAARNEVAISIPIAGAHTIELLNARGQVVRLVRGSQPANYQVPLGRGSDGMYLLRLSLPDGQTMVKRLVAGM